MEYTHKYIDGVLTPLSAEEIAELQARDEKNAAEEPARLLAEVRQKRNELLASTDWTVLADAPDSIKKNFLAWEQYRQALRDVTSQADLKAIVWPVAPV